MPEDNEVSISKEEKYRQQVLLKMDKTFREGVQFGLDMGLDPAAIMGCIVLFGMDIHKQMLELAHTVKQDKTEEDEGEGNN